MRLTLCAFVTFQENITYLLTAIGQVLEKIKGTKNLNPCHQMTFQYSKYAKIAFAAGAKPKTPLGELTAVPQTP